ncbi:hypothetical protein [Herbaspirillum sp. SJZ107]|uniref:hypothetical protein n=1 Tax=Herbaspirillum sp. SJZ107 TaxID=2572881 RepID=UPI00114F55FD|nr:hypothetical protein [Herbaspirillum sp. SJZ107]
MNAPRAVPAAVTVALAYGRRYELHHLHHLDAMGAPFSRPEIVTDASGAFKFGKSMARCNADRRAHATASAIPC